jgi:GNAT superfamily N-acetyltransferase
VTPYFASYAPEAHGTPLDAVEVRRGEASDLPQCAELMAQREGGEVGKWTRRMQAWLEQGHVIFVADRRGTILGFGRVCWLTPVADGGRNAPDGWYLNGIVVEAHHRRRGLGRALVQARCRWAWEQGERIYFVANAVNRASLDLHREVGFRELSRDFEMPGVTFTGGEGVLFGADASSKGQQVTQLRVRAAG